MCGRYALGVRMAFARQRMQEQGLQVDSAPDDDEVRETFNFAPGYNGAVYRAAVRAPSPSEDRTAPPEEQDVSAEYKALKVPDDKTTTATTSYLLQSMKWGLIPFWTKRQPDYGSLMRTINCREDSLIEDRGMWTSMKRRKRCVVVCQGFYEWLKKGPGGKEKVPHFIRRKDGDLMYFAGLWDSVKYEGTEEPLYTYTVITTSSNPYLKFLHDRMPVILEPNSEAMKTWLDPSRTSWSKELQAVLKPYEGELECYPVPKEVGKVGNNSPDFIVPVSSKENKNNIANFFANAKKKAEPADEKEDGKGTVEKSGPKVVKDEEEQRPTKESEWSEDNAPKPVSGIKREHPAESPNDDDGLKKPKVGPHTPSPKKGTSPSKQQAVHSGRKTRSATHNQKPLKKGDEKKTPDGSQRITNFFSK